MLLRRRQKRHGHRYSRFRGPARVACQCLLAAAQNIKKITLAQARLGLKTSASSANPSKKQNPAENRRGLSVV